VRGEGSDAAAYGELRGGDPRLIGERLVQCLHGLLRVRVRVGG
jgi:hypothetical protein